MTSAYACERCQDKGTESLFLDLGSCPECHHLGTPCPGPDCPVCAIQRAQYERLQARTFSGQGASSAQFR